MNRNEYIWGVMSHFFVFERPIDLPGSRLAVSLRAPLTISYILSQCAAPSLCKHLRKKAAPTAGPANAITRLLPHLFNSVCGLDCARRRANLA